MGDVEVSIGSVFTAPGTGISGTLASDLGAGGCVSAAGVALVCAFGRALGAAAGFDLFPLASASTVWKAKQELKRV